MNFIDIILKDLRVNDNLDKKLKNKWLELETSASRTVRTVRFECILSEHSSELIQI